MVSLASAALASPLALACNRTAERGSLQEQVLRAHKKASVVVLAKVVEAGFQDALASAFGESPTHLARLEVIETWKGKHEARTLVQTVAPTSDGTCGTVLTPGETYLLYLHDKEPYNLALSSRNARLVDATQDIEILRSRF